MGFWGFGVLGFWGGLVGKCANGVRVRGSASRILKGCMSGHWKDLCGGAERM